MPHYAIETANAAEDYFAHEVVIGNDAPAGTVPPEVEAHARMLAQIIGHGTTWSVAAYSPLVLDGTTKSQSWQCHLTEGWIPTRPDCTCESCSRAN